MTERGRHINAALLCHCEADEVSRSNLGGGQKDCHAPIYREERGGFHPHSNPLIVKERIPSRLELQGGLHASKVLGDEF